MLVVACVQKQHQDRCVAVLEKDFECLPQIDALVCVLCVCVVVTVCAIVIECESERQKVRVFVRPRVSDCVALAASVLVICVRSFVRLLCVLALYGLVCVRVFVSVPVCARAPVCAQLRASVLALRDGILVTEKVCDREQKQTQVERQAANEHLLVIACVTLRDRV